jgi:ABC-type polysaccharide/polyol phosphate export permease
MVLHSGETLMGITWWLVSTAVIALALRFYVRIKLSHHVGSDDYMMLIAGVCCLPINVTLHH